MAHIGIGVDQTTQDIRLDADHNLWMVTGAQAVGQHARARLKLHHGEWFLDTEAGVRWLDEVLGQGFSEALADAVIKESILGTDGVTEIVSFSASYNRTRRELIATDIALLTTYDVEVIV